MQRSWWVNTPAPERGQTLAQEARAGSLRFAIAPTHRDSTFWDHLGREPLALDPGLSRLWRQSKPDRALGLREGGGMAPPWQTQPPLLTLRCTRAQLRAGVTARGPGEPTPGGPGIPTPLSLALGKFPPKEFLLLKTGWCLLHRHLPQLNVRLPHPATVDLSRK